jgi:hypothetical protein
LQYDKLPLITEKVWGVSLPATSGNVMSNMGLFTGIYRMGTLADANDADGRAKRYSTAPTTNQDAGNITWPGEYDITQPRYNPVLTCKFKLGDTVNLRFMCGWQSNYALASDDPNTLACVLLRASTSAVNTNFVAYVSNGSGASTILDFPTPVPIDTNLHLLEIAISGDGASVRFTLDNQSVVVTTTLPNAQQDLGFECRVKTLEDTSKSFRYYSAQVVSR